MMWKRTGTTVVPRKLMRCARSAVTTRLAWIFSLGVGGGVPQSRFGAAERILRQQRIDFRGGGCQAGAGG